MISTFFSQLIRFVLRAITYVNGLWLLFILVFLIILPGLAELVTSISSPATIDQQTGHQNFPAATCAIIWPYLKLLNLGDINCFSANTNNFELVPFPAAVLLVLLDGLLLGFIEAAEGVENYRGNKKAEEVNLRYAEQKRVQELFEEQRREASFRQAEFERNRAIEKAEAVRREHIENLIKPDELADKQVELQTIKASLAPDFPFLEKGYRHHPTRKHSTRRVTPSRKEAHDPSQQNNQNQGEL